MSTQLLSATRTYLEGLVGLTNSGDAYIGSTLQLQELNEGYQASAYRYDWAQLLKRGGTVIVANVKKYGLPSDFRKFRQLFSLDNEFEEIEFNVLKSSVRSYAVDADSTFSTKQFWVSDLPTAASPAYVLTNNESAGNAVVIELDTVTGLSVGEEIFVNGTTPEFTSVSAVDTTAKTITARLVNATGASKSLYRSSEIIHYQYYRSVTLLSAAGDTTLLPDETDFIYPHYSAFLFYNRLEQSERAQKQYELWQSRLENAWLAWDKNSTGAVGEFSVG